MEKSDLIDMIGEAAAAVTVSPDSNQRLKRFKQRLGLDVT
jgi:peroxiredoxin